MPRYAVIADDLTGAADTGVQFALAGLRTRLVRGDPGDVANLDVLVFNTDSRSLPAEGAAARVRAAVETARAHGVETFYKKVDSLLRGNLGAEIDAVLDALGGAYALVCPAFPANGRTIVGGHLLVHGEPVSRAAIGPDGSSPVGESHLPTLLDAQTRRTVAHLDLSVAVAGTDAVRATLEDLLTDGADLVAADAVSDEDLAALVDAAYGVGLPCVFVGSAGLARPLATRWAGPPSQPEPAGARVVVVVGSLQPMAREQVSVLAGEQRLPLLRLDLEMALGPNEEWQAWLDRTREQVLADAAGASVMVVVTPAEPDDVARAREYGSQQGLDESAVDRLLARRLAELTRVVLDSFRPAGLVVAGGDTAAAVLDVLEAEGFDLADEVAPGVPVGRVAGGLYAGLGLVTKAGGFGRRDVLLQAVRLLAERSA